GGAGAMQPAPIRAPSASTPRPDTIFSRPPTELLVACTSRRLSLSAAGGKLLEPAAFSTLPAGLATRGPEPVGDGRAAQAALAVSSSVGRARRARAAATRGTRAWRGRR